MSLSALLGLATGILLLVASPLGFVPQRHHVMPGGYQIPARFQAVSLPRITSAEALLPAATNCLDNWARVSSGDRLRIVSDETVPPIVVEAFQQASKQRGVDSHLHTLSDRNPQSRQLRELNPGDFDATVVLAYFPPDQRLPIQISEERQVHVVSVPELLASDWARVPLALMEELATRTHSRVAAGRTAHITDAAGTDLTFRYRTPEISEDDLSRKLLSHFPPSYQVSLELTDSDGAFGWIATHSQIAGFFPLGKFQVARGALVSVVGGGSLGERLKASLMRPDRQVQFKGLHLSTSPAAIRYNQGYSGSAFRWGHEAGTQRAGVASLRFGINGTESTHPENHSLQVFFPNLRIEGEPLVQEGYLATLGAQPVVQLAASLGASSLLIPQCGAESLPRLPEHVNPTITAVETADSMRPNIRALISDWMQLASSERLLLLTDDSVPEILYNVFSEELRAGHQLEVAAVAMPETPADLASRLQTYADFDLPEEIWNQIASSDVVVSLTYFPFERLRRNDASFEEWLGSVQTRFFAAAGLPEVYASPWAAFPAPLLRNLARYTYSRGRVRNTFSLSTNEGSDLSFNFERIRSVPKILPEPGFYAYHALPANQFFAVAPAEGTSVEGMVITRRLDGMVVPRLALTLLDNQLVGVDGEGGAADWIRQRLQQNGGIRLKRAGTWVNPKTFPWPEAPYSGWTPSFWAAAGNIFRSGILHVEFEGAVAFSVQLQIANSQVGGQELVGLGRFMVLEDPNLKALADEEGYNPEQWLSEDWMPTFGQ